MLITITEPESFFDCFSSHKGENYTLKELSVIAKSGDSRKKKASIIVKTSKYNIPVKIVF